MPGAIAAVAVPRPSTDEPATTAKTDSTAAEAATSAATPTPETRRMVRVVDASNLLKSSWLPWATCSARRGNALVASGNASTAYGSR
ncbi:hypothetical protein D1872_331640 [compost metagenome]